VYAFVSKLGITSRMTAVGYGRECVQVYASIHKLGVDSALRGRGCAGSASRRSASKTSINQ
jgi:hypothetical protein